MVAYPGLGCFGRLLKALPMVRGLSMDLLRQTLQRLPVLRVFLTARGQ
jgi:hypothetical protein